MKKRSTHERNYTYILFTHKIIGIINQEYRHRLWELFHSDGHENPAGSLRFLECHLQK